MIRYRIFLFIWSLSLTAFAPSGLFGASPKKPVEEVELYFPSQIGSRWSYYGSIVDQIQRVETYLNTTTVSGTAVKNGVPVKVISESNQANNGPVESYFVFNESGITYYGSSTTTPFEKQIVPYKIIPFPIYPSMSYPQIDRRGISFGRDFDQDGKEETVDVIAKMNVLGFETISVPGGVFKQCLKLQGIMDLYITLSSSRKLVKMVDTTTNWFAPGVGLIKWIERTDFPSVNGGPAQSTVIIEELNTFSIEKTSLH
jgi:hypothetical protein